MQGSTEVIRRRSLTLSDQLSMVHHESTNLRDLLKLPDSSDPCGNQNVIRSPDSSPGNQWRTLRDLLQLQPNANPNPSPASEASHEVGGTETERRVSLMALLEEGERNLTGGPRTSEGDVDTVETSEVAGAGQDELVRVSLMALLEQSERNFSCGSLVDVAEVVEEEHVAEEEGLSHVCCVCMVRRKGAAFIPCGHTFCRRCSRELHMGRGMCPLCNGVIVEVLDIF